jgi:hypothetical protein
MKKALDRDVTTPSPYPGVFAFELDFGGTLRCIPMSVRMKLDQAGIKLSLKQWNKLPEDARRQLVAKPCVENEQIELYRHYLLSLVETFTESSPELASVEASPPWTDVAVVPARIVAWARQIDVAPPSPQQWRALTPLQRFALFKLTRPGHSNENFIPAMREFSVMR